MSTNKIALVTGGSRGLGKNAAQHLAKKGIDVIITYRSKKEEAEEVVASVEKSGQKAAALQLDTGIVKSFDGFISQLTTVLQEKWGRNTFDFLINNAGIDAASKFAETTEEDFDNLVNIHFKGVYFLTQKSLPVIADGGRIINFSTGLARFATPGYAAYASMKGAIEVLTKYLAKELGPRGIAANVVAPGIIETDFTKEAFSHEGMHDRIASITALGRPGMPDDIGGIVAFLCTEEARWINAQRIEASGGMFL
ncbi:NAD(P)-dependent dehydrogenase, short-chain alcohol dehydrogenase family [Mucilaginibacter lappiensis]|uniref:NAD(P)-dependent dehydrogenase (Short-subunit alcohol dehydrogenase family) n=1 Tax=Mucilaginibacter lappiensis TaxID=354630 RepID=A0ABR6PIR0_9SPHI|nr:SDR family oxidoreductase [Mucilaginibacter lappiensis]MBB6109661.1 NAD(P)-dependent dehydrogenase (short-subunit alcohol dehydrogenase family) [Mucilaginibacter lappiensis]SIR10952.1 NAD(P)-dependent dehydrogenase, short-chain alcohol dehydrogenase family [Mucilaginibacter lappiensis]